MRWTEDLLRTKFAAKVREERHAEGLDPDVRPTQQWIREHGYSGIEGFARRNDMTVSEVLEEICGFDSPSSKPLGIKHAETRRLVEEWLEKEQDLFNTWGDGRVQDARTHFRTLSDIAFEGLGSTNLLRLVRADPALEVEHLMALFSGLASHMESEGAQSNYTRSLERWADYLALMEEIDGHKVADVREMMGYSYERRSPEHDLTAEQVRRCWRAAETLEEKALVIILTTSGTRRSEPTDTPVDSLRLDREDPYIVFDEDRKTSAATVPIMAGVGVVEDWIEELENEVDHWDGEWLFPSKKSRDGSRPGSWVNDTVEKLVKRAGITFPDGEEPTPKSFRSFWYKRYAEARLEWLSHLETIAEEQGVSSAKIIDQHYLTDRPERRHFRRFARSYFAAVFGEEMLSGTGEVRGPSEDDADAIVQKVIDDYEEDAISDLQADDDESGHQSSAASDPITAWGQRRLQAEHAAAAASGILDGYPPSPGRAAVAGVGLVCMAAVTGLLWGSAGALDVAPLTGAVVPSPTLLAGLLIGILVVVDDLPDLEPASPAR